MRSLAPFCVALALFAGCGPAALAAGRDAEALLDALPERVESQSVPVRRISLVLWYLDYDEVLVGSAEGPARLSGEWDLDLGNRAGSLRCIGSARNRVVPPQAVEGERCDGVSGDAVLSCSDGRTIRLRIDREEHCLAATGRGRDSAGNPVRALLGGSRARLEALVTGVLAETAGRPLLASAAASRAATAPRGVRSGTAFFISTDGYLVTADHAVARAQRVEVRLDDGDRLEAEIVARDPDHDLALLRVEAIGAPLELRSEHQLAPGEQVFAIGYPARTTGVSAERVRAGRVTGLQARTRERRFVEMDAPIEPGFSGGPLLDSTGDVVGVVTSMGEPRGAPIAERGAPVGGHFALVSDLVHRFLEEHVGAPPRLRAQPGSPRAPADLAREAQVSVVRVVAQ